MKNTILRWELSGIPIIFLAGSLLHFVFKWTGEWKPVALLAAVNESTWEHLKLAFWPGMGFALLEYLSLRRRARGLWTAKAFGLLAMPMVIVVGFYGYTAILGRHVLFADILLFALAVAIGQLVSHHIMQSGKFSPAAQRYAILALVLLIFSFSLLTFYPPRIFLFQDPNSYQYGILK